MSTITHKLCDEIVEPVFQTSSRISGPRNSSRLVHHCSSKQNGKTSTSTIVEKKKVVNRITPRDSVKDRTTVKHLKSKETFLKNRLTDKAVNTFVSGPLRCDNASITMVCRRNNRCKCIHKHVNIKNSSKQIQTFDTKSYMHSDKACAQCVETVSCATQFFEKLSRSVLKAKPSVFKISKEIKITPKEFKIHQDRINALNSKNRISIVCDKGARRWALSQYPTRGPDF